MYLGSYNIFTFWEITGNISGTVQDKVTAIMED